MDVNAVKRALLQILIIASIWLVISYTVSPEWTSSSRFWNMAVMNIITIVIVAFANTTFLLPKFYFEKRLFSFVVLSILMAAVLAIIIREVMPSIIGNGPFDDEGFRRMLENRFPGLSADTAGLNAEDFSIRRSSRMNNMRWFMSMPPFILAFFGSALVEVTRFANIKQRENIELEKQKLVTEIKFLKAQINPHFLFNALNNIYTLALTKSDNAPDNLLRLSNMLRYMVYDCSAKKVPLHKEVDYLRDYLALASLKDSSGMKIHANFEVSNQNIMVPPLLFIPFVENAFKHSNIEDIKNGWIKIDLTSLGQGIDFKVENSLFQGDGPKDSRGGIGLDNVRKRLKLIYDDAFSLDTESQSDSFITHLTIDHA